jgi:KUP system potassium uptake protein
VNSLTAADVGTPRTRARHGASALTLGALGIVFGDIGTSPLYALKACFAPEYGLAVTPENVTGLVSLIIWTLTFIVSIKYVAFIMRADNCGEGGIFALLALVLPVTGQPRSTRAGRALIVLGLIGAALLYGDGVITPAISVLSAVEGMKVSAPALSHLVVPISVVILVLLFGSQRFGTARIGRVFGPLMFVWFSVIGVLGAVELAGAPRFLLTLSPVAGLRFLLSHGVHGLTVLGAVVLAVTGAEALYADMGHFGKRPIRRAWFWLVFPTLILNYLGQGALLARTPAAVENPFFRLAHPSLLVALVILATLATIVASQALISGAFSLTQQAVQLGYAPRMRILHTSASSAGQIYIPSVNTALALSCLLLVVAFQSSDRLAAAYGIAVTGTMAVTSCLFYAVARGRWKWTAAHAGAVTGVFLTVDLLFFGTNLLKLFAGGWVPITIGAVLFILMTTWRTGHDAVIAARRRASAPLARLFEQLDAGAAVRVPGVAIFFTAHAEGAPEMVLRQVRQMKALPEIVVLLGITTVSAPEVAPEDSVTVEPLSHGFLRATARIGFMQSPKAENMVAAMRAQLPPKLDDLVYFTSHDHVRVSGAGAGAGTGVGVGNMFRWQKQLFALMGRNVGSTADFFHVPPDAAVELGAEVEI